MARKGAASEEPKPLAQRFEGPASQAAQERQRDRADDDKPASRQHEQLRAQPTFAFFAAGPQRRCHRSSSTLSPDEKLSEGKNDLRDNDAAFQRFGESGRNRKAAARQHARQHEP